MFLNPLSGILRGSLSPARLVITAAALGLMAALLVEVLLPSRHESRVQFRLALSPLCRMHCSRSSHWFVDRYVATLESSTRTAVAARYVSGSIEPSALLRQSELSCRLRFGLDWLRQPKELWTKLVNGWPLGLNSCAVGVDYSDDFVLEITAWADSARRAQELTAAWSRSLVEWRNSENVTLRPEDRIYADTVSDAVRDTRQDQALAIGATFALAWLFIGSLLARATRRASVTRDH